MTRMRIATAIVVAVLFVVGGLGGYFYAMKKAWIRYNEYDIRTEGQLQVGDLVPDLELQRTDGRGRQRLSDYYGKKPTVLAFGSYT